MEVFGVSGLMLLGGLLAGRALALDGNVQQLGSLKQFEGMWAHSEQDCEKLRNNTFEGSEEKFSESIGICEKAIDILNRPVNCAATNIVSQDDVVEFQAACLVHSDSADRRERALIKIIDANTIMFTDQEFTIFGKYVRCSHEYKCWSP
jgi:hypothetical protein